MNPNELRVRLRNLVAAPPRPWYRVANQSAGPTQIYLYNDIGMGGVYADELVDELRKINGPVELHLSSGGGEIFEGIPIYNNLCSRDVTVYIDGLAGSAASFIAMAASPGKLYMAKTASMMIHEGQVMAAGNASELMALVDVLERESKKIAGIYADRSGLAGHDADYFRAKMKIETWYDAEEALAEGLVDAIFDPRTGQDVALSRPAARAAVQTGTLVNTATAAAGAKQLGDGWVQDPDGKTRFDPDGDGDDDSTPEGDTDHDYFDPDGKQIKPIPPRPTPAGNHAAAAVVLNAVPPDHGPMSGTHTHPHPAYAGPEGGADAMHSHEHTHNGDNLHHHTHDAPGAATEAAASAGTAVLNADGVDTTPWDADKAWHNGTTSEDPAAFYEAICAGKKNGDPSTRAGWALPYKYTPSSPPNAGGVRAALAVLGGARGGVQGLINRTEAQDTLQAAMKKVNPDWKPGDQIETGLLSAVMLELVKGGR
jgi:ATP-dependent protease ClpP protease subunit